MNALVEESFFHLALSVSAKLDLRRGMLLSTLSLGASLQLERPERPERALEHPLFCSIFAFPEGVKIYGTNQLLPRRRCALYGASKWALIKVITESKWGRKRRRVVPNPAVPGERQKSKRII